MQYTFLADLYDKLTFDVNYTQIADGIENHFRRCGKKPELVLDLACGTGSLTVELARRGYDMIGLDASEDMLTAAREKAAGLPNILLLEQDMRSFELYGTVDTVVCVLDSLNYVTQDLDQVFRLVHNYLNPGGLFLFDVNSEYKYREVLSDNTFVYETEDVYYVWDNCPDGGLMHFYLDFFVQQQNGDYRRFCEEHTQKVYKRDELSSLLRESGFKQEGIFDGYCEKMAGELSERLLFCASCLK